MLLYAYDHGANENHPVIVNLPTHPNGYSHQLLDNLQISRLCVNVQNVTFLLMAFKNELSYLDNNFFFLYSRWAGELRFYCKTDAVKRVIHFKTSNPGIIETAYDGKLHFNVSDWT